MRAGSGWIELQVNAGGKRDWRQLRRQAGHGYRGSRVVAVQDTRGIRLRAFDLRVGSDRIVSATAAWLPFRKGRAGWTAAALTTESRRILDGFVRG